MTFSKSVYLATRPWLTDSYLVTPANGTATKRCKLCERELYTVEFDDNKQAIDGKVAVCIECRRGEKLKKKDGQ